MPCGLELLGFLMARNISRRMRNKTQLYVCDIVPEFIDRMGEAKSTAVRRVVDTSVCRISCQPSTAKTTTAMIYNKTSSYP